MPFIPLDATETGSPSSVDQQGLSRGFIPLAEDKPARGFIPLDKKSDSHWYDPALKTTAEIGRVYPVIETAANLATQAVALPAAGLAGIGAAAGKAIGLTEADPSAVVENVAGALTYRPQSEAGKSLNEKVMLPFEKLAEAGRYAGDKTLDATGSPVLATVVDTAINAAPMAIGPVKSGASKVADRFKAKPGTSAETAAITEPRSGFTPLEDVAADTPGGPHVQTPAPPQTAALPDSKAITQDAMRAMSPTGSLPVPLTKMAAEFSASQKAKATGVPHDVVEHPEAPGKFTAVPEQVSQDIAQKSVEASRQTTEDVAPGVNPTAVETLPGSLGAPEALVEDMAMRQAAQEQGIAASVPKDIAQPDPVIQQKTATFDDKLEGAAAIEQPANPSASTPVDMPKTIEPVAQQRTGEFNAEAGNYATSKSVDHFANGVTPEALDSLFAESRAKHAKAMAPLAADPISTTSAESSTTLPLQEAVNGGSHTPLSPLDVLPEQRPAQSAAVMRPQELLDAARPQEGRQGRFTALSDAVTQKSEQAAAERVLGADVRGLDDATLANIAEMRVLSAKARSTVRDEMSRREESIPASSADQTPTVQRGFMPLKEDLQSQSGDAHIGFIQDKPSTIETPTAFDKPLRREEVLAPLVKALNVPIYEGRVKGKGVLGLYRPNAEMVRIKKPSDLEVTAHEVAHLLDDRIPEIQKAYENIKEFREELQAVSYDKSKINEGFAEFVRLYMTQPEMAAEKAPAFNGWFNDFINRHEYGPVIKQAQDGMTAWYGQDALARAQSKIGAKTAINDALGGMWGKFRQSVSDDLHGVYRMERELTGKINPTGAYESARLTRAAHSIADGAIRHGYLAVKEDGSYTFKGKGLEQILDPVSDRLDDFLLYAVGESAKELKTQGREHLFTDAEIDSMRKLKQPEFVKAFEEYQKWNQGIVDFAESRGVINPASRAMWQRQSYMPFHRIGQPGDARSMKPGEWSGIKALTGGTDNLRPILGNMISNAVMLIDKAVKNEAMQKVTDMADTQRGGGRFMVKIPTESRPVRVEQTQVLKEVLKSLGVEESMGPEAVALAAQLKQQIESTPGFYEFLLNNQSPAGSNVISVMREGKHHYYEVADPLVVRALKALDREHQSIWVNWLGLPKRIGQLTVTLTPDFMVANIARDTLMGSIMSQHGFRPVIDSIKGMVMRLEKDQNYKDYIANGGGLSSQFVDETRFRHHLEKFYSRKGIDYRTVLDTPDKLLGFVEELADSFEMSTRLGEYQRAIDKGEHPRHAAYMGREVSTDFAMRGDNQVVGFFYDTVMFLRPMVESIDRLGRGVAHDPNAKGIAVKTGALALTSMALYLHNRNNSDYNDMEDWKKDAYWHFYIPGSEGKNKHFMFPKVWEIGAVSSLAERTMERTMNEDPEGLGKDVARILSTTFHINLMPQVAAPLYEQATNRNGFTKAPIETPGMENVQPFLRAKHGTSETMKALGMATKDMPEALQFNPARGEALLRGYFNTWAMYGLQMSDAILYGDKLPEKRLDQYPVIRRFYEGETPTHTKYESMFYDLLGEANRLRGTLHKLDDMGLSDIADQKESDPLADKATQLQRVSKYLSTIEKDIEEVKHSSDLSPEEKRGHIDSLTLERNALLKAAVEDVKPTPGK